MSGEVALPVLEILSPKHHQRRWRMAFIAISFPSALASLLNPVTDNHSKPLRSLSHIAININSSCSVSHGPFYSLELKAALAHLAKGRSLTALEQLGGAGELVKHLKSDLMEGINPDDQDDLAQRRCFFGANSYHRQSAKRFPIFFLEAWRDMTAITLLVCAVMSLASGIIEHGLEEGWYDGGIILVAIFLVVALSAWSKFNQSREFQRLFDQSNDIKVQVVRGGRHQGISIFDVVVGDVVLLGIGDQVPADGLFFAGGSLMIDESRVTGEIEPVRVNGSINPFLLSGAKVADGAGRMLVTSVGMNTIWCEMLSSRICNLTYELTPLQDRFKKLTSKIEKVGFVVIALVLVASLIWYFTGSTRDDSGHREFNGSKAKAIDVLKSIIGIITAALSISRSLSPAVWLILNYSKWMMKYTAIVRNISACETLGSITTICIDKRGTLTRDNVESCRRAGVSVKMVTSDNVDTARAIAIECGILTPEEDIEDKAIVDGVEFGNYSPEERMERINDVRVMARSSPLDKLLMVQCLKKKGHVVAVTGDGTNDAPALKEADIGLSMGIQVTDVAKESSDIVILDDNLTSVMTVLWWGSSVYSNILKFIQFQLTVNISAFVIDIILAISSGKTPLTVVQQLWVNLVMDNLGALALATETPTHDLKTFTPVPRAQSLITIIMWRDAIAQIICQVVILTIIYFTGKSTFRVDEKVNDTIMFNTFFFFQFFNLFNAKILDRKDVLKGIHKNKLFVAIIGIIMVLQVLMLELMSRISGAERLTWGQWGTCFGIAALSLPIARIVKCIPGFTKVLD